MDQSAQLFRQALERVRRRFEKCVDCGRAVGVRLVHSDLSPPVESAAVVWRFVPFGHSDSSPVVSHSLNFSSNTDSQASKRWTRSDIWYGTHEAVEELSSACNEAGQLLRQLPIDHFREIWERLLRVSGSGSIGPDTAHTALWVTTVFEVAFGGAQVPGLHSRKWVRCGNASVLLDELIYRKHQSVDLFAEQIADFPDQPREWYAEILDFATASAKVCDMLLQRVQWSPLEVSYKDITAITGIETKTIANKKLSSHADPVNPGSIPLRFLWAKVRPVLKEFFSDREIPDEAEARRILQERST